MDGTFSRREAMRRLLVGAAAGAAWPVVSPSHPIYAHLLNGPALEAADAALAVASPKPQFLTAEQMATLSPLGEVMVPGSRSARVSEFIDLLLSVDSKKHQDEFVASLDAIDAEARRSFGGGFAAINANQRVQTLTRASEAPASSDSSAPGLREHFENLKEWIVGAYYSSEIGMRELGWTSNRIFEKLPECDHAAHA